MDFNPELDKDKAEIVRVEIETMEFAPPIEEEKAELQWKIARYKASIAKRGETK